jgi:hypothetical protein
LATRDSQVQRVIETLRRQRVRQGDFKPVLDCVIVQATVINELSPNDALVETARHMKSRAQELQRMEKSVPKFVVEDLLEETIERLEQAQRQQPGS